MEEPSHPAGVGTPMHLEEELLAGRRRKHVRVMRAASWPRLDTYSSERAARDLVSGLRDLVLRGRHSERSPPDRVRLYTALPAPASAGPKAQPERTSASRGATR